MSSHTVSPAESHELLPALRLLSDRDAPDLFDRDDTGLLVARGGGGRLRGAVLVQALPGALGVVRPPRAETAEVAEALARAARDWLVARGVKVCQAFVSGGESQELAALERVGFRWVTRLVFLRRELAPDGLLLPDPTGRIELRPVSPSADEFRAVLLATHEGTLDCPELTGERTADELLAGLTEPTPGGAWFLAVEAGLAVGVVILASGPYPEAAELSYLGVVPAARGCGVGDELVRFAVRAATLAGEVAIAVNADERNEPALRLYRRHGFAGTDRREVFLAQWPQLRPARET